MCLFTRCCGEVRLYALSRLPRSCTTPYCFLPPSLCVSMSFLLFTPSKLRVKVATPKPCTKCVHCPRHHILVTKSSSSFTILSRHEPHSAPLFFHPQLTLHVCRPRPQLSHCPSRSLFTLVVSCCLACHPSHAARLALVPTCNCSFQQYSATTRHVLASCSFLVSCVMLFVANPTH